MKRDRLHKITVAAILSAVSTVLMFISFSVPIAPSYLKIDFSDLPALLSSYALGPFWGVAVALVKNAVNVLFTTTGGVGELSNFLLSSLFVLPAGFIYNKNRTRKNALIGALAGILVSTVLSYFTNTFLVYPAYVKIIPIDAIIGMSKAILPSVDTVSDVILFFNVPFTFVKAALNTVLAFLLYKRLSPILRTGKNK